MVIFMGVPKHPTNKAPGKGKRGYDLGLTRNGVPTMQRLPEGWREERARREEPKLAHLRNEWVRIRTELVKRGLNPEMLDKEKAAFMGAMNPSYDERMKLEQFIDRVGREHSIQVNWEIPAPKKKK